MKKFLAVAIAVLLVGAAVPAAGAFGIRWKPHLAEIDGFLADELRAGRSELTVIATGSSMEQLSRAATARGLRVVARLEAIDSIAVAGPVPSILDLRRDSAVQRLTGNRPITFAQQTSHIATRGTEVLEGFTAYRLEEQPPTPGEKKRTCRNVRERRNGRTHVVRRCTTTTTPPTPRPPVERAVEVAPADGSGVSIAVLDSGVDGTHPMFMDNGTSRVVRNLRLACVATVNGTELPCDGEDRDPGDGFEMAFVDHASTYNNSDYVFAGHGTHVASIAAGGTATTADGRRIHGAAPGAKVVALGVGANNLMLDTLVGLEWILENHRAPCGEGADPSLCPPIGVVNNSWGSSGGPHDPSDPTSMLVRRLVEAGVVVVFAHGNDGGDGTENNANPEAQSPLPGVIAVASGDDHATGTRLGSVSTFSSRGKAGNHQSYPDVLAPGSSILGACRPYMNPVYGCNSLDAADPNYGTISGTSMAAPHVAGIVAQLIEAADRLGKRDGGPDDVTPAVIEDILEDTAFKMPAGALYEADTLNDGTTSFDKGHGLVDAKAAIARLHELYLKDAAAPAQVPCAGATVLDDPEGDATDAQVRGAGPNEPALDIRSLTVEAAPDGSSTTFTITVTDLGEENPDTAPNAAWNVYFRHANGGYYAEALRAADGSTSFSFGESPSVDAGVTSATTRVPAATASGSFDAAAERVAITIDADTLSAAGVAPIAAGTGLTELQVVTRRSATPAAVGQGPAADDATASCSFVVGTGAVDFVVPPTPEADGHLTEQTPIYTWSGTTGPDVVVPFTGFNASGCDGSPSSPGCDVEHISVALPAAGQVLKVEITESSDASLPILYVYGPNGEQVAQGSGVAEGAVESSGLYTVVVRSFASPTGDYAARALLPGIGNEPAPEIVLAGQAQLRDGDSYVVEDAPEAVQFNHTCAGMADPACFTYAIDVVPGDGAGTLAVSVTAFELSDYDVYVYDAAGAEIGTGSGLPATVGEETAVGVTTGRYYVVVQPFTATPQTPFTLEVSLS